jgi:ERCC4-related helicase
MTGQIAPEKRREAWRTKRVFFVTPQILTNDISRQACDAKSIVCLVVDEAHRALGNYAYCTVVKAVWRLTWRVMITLSHQLAYSRSCCSDRFCNSPLPRPCAQRNAWLYAST